jgi:elongator complex protein 5
MPILSSKARPGSINVIIDSVDTLSTDMGSTAEPYQFLRDLHSLIRARQSASRISFSFELSLMTL